MKAKGVVFNVFRHTQMLFALTGSVVALCSSGSSPKALGSAVSDQNESLNSGVPRLVEEKDGIDEEPISPPVLPWAPFCVTPEPRVTLGYGWVHSVDVPCGEVSTAQWVCVV